MAAVVRAAPTPTKAPAPVAAPAPARVAPVVPAGPRLNLGGGAPIPTPTRMRLESSLGANLSGVRVHSGPGAATAAGNLNARAFAFGPQIVLGSGQRADDLPLMGHEAAHVIQQQAAPTPQRWADGVTLPPANARGFAGPAVVLGRAAGERATLQRWTPSGSDRYEGEANRAAAAVARGEPFAVTERTAGPRVQRFGLGDVLDYFADKANNIPGFRMFTIVLGVNPINMSGVDRSAANILRAVIEFIPGGSLITQALDNHGIIDKVANWVSEQIKSLGMIGGAIKDAVLEFLDSLGWRDIFHLGDVWDRAKRIFTVPIDRIIDFAKNLITGIITFIKDAILIPLAKLAEGTRAWDLLIAVLGKNPITGEAVPRTAETLIAGFLKLIGQEAVWENIKRANALGRAWAWFQGTLGGLIALVSSLPGRAIAAFKSLELMDIILLPRAFIKIGAVFGGFVLDFIGWAGNALWNLLEIVFDVVSPGAFGYIKRTGAALKSILKNPFPFLGNLVKAALLGFNNFTNKFGKYLQDGLIDWLTGSLPGIYIPKAFSFPEIVKFALSVLGLSWANVREKLVKATSETAVKAMEVGFDIVKTLVKDGPAAAWDQIKTQLGNLQKLVIDGITDLVVDAVVTKGIPKLLAMLIPGAGFIPAILSIYDIVMVFVKKLAQIAAVVKSFVDSIVAIAAGNIAGAAARVEAALAGLLTLAINFLAGFAGLGKIADKLKGVFDKVRAPIDKALDWLVNWIVTAAKKLGKLAASGARRVLNWWRERRQMRLGDGEPHTLQFRGGERNARLMLASAELPVQDHLNAAKSDPSLSAAARGRAATALAYYQSEIAPVSGVALPDPVPAPLQAKLDALPNAMNRLTELLIAIADRDIAMPTASFAWGGPGAASAEQLSNRGSRGGRGTGSSQPKKGWELIAQRGLTKRNGNWVQMHMISAAYGGLDVPGNLIPAPTAVNTGGAVRGFERLVEGIFYGDKKAKEVRAARSLFKVLQDRKTVLWLRTTTGGFHPAGIDPATKAPIYDASTYVTSVTLEGGIYFPRGGQWVKDPTALASETTPVPPPDFSGTYVPAVSSIGEPTLARIAGIPTNFAREIVKRGPFSGPANFYARMRAGRAGEGVAMTPELEAAMDKVKAAVPKLLKWKD